MREEVGRESELIYKRISIFSHLSTFIFKKPIILMDI